MKYLLIILALTLTASARIGETIEECKKRYGKVTIKTNKHKMKYAQFYKNNFKILCLFDEGKCAYIIYLCKRSNFKEGQEKQTYKELRLANGAGREVWSYHYPYTKFTQMKYLDFFDKKLIETKIRIGENRGYRIMIIDGLNSEEIAFAYINISVMKKLNNPPKEETPKSGKTKGL